MNDIQREQIILNTPHLYDMFRRLAPRVSHTAMREFLQEYRKEVDRYIKGKKEGD